MKYELPSEGRKYFSLSFQERVEVRFPPVETPSVSPCDGEKRVETPPLSSPERGGKESGNPSFVLP
jgi:hypothetical protein